MQHTPNVSITEEDDRGRLQTGTSIPQWPKTRTPAGGNYGNAATWTVSHSRTEVASLGTMGTLSLQLSRRHISLTCDSESQIQAVCSKTGYWGDDIQRTPSIVSNIMPLIDVPECGSLALRLLATVAYHGGDEVHLGIARQTPALLRVLQESPNDLTAAELVISTLAHATRPVIYFDEAPSDMVISVLNIPTLVQLVTEFMRRPGAVLSALVRLEGLSSESDQRSGDPAKLGAYAIAGNRRAFLQCAQDHDLHALGMSPAEIISRTEFSIVEGSFQYLNERTRQMEVMDVGLPFNMWTDALPHCAKAIRAKGRPGGENMAETLEVESHIIRSRVGDAVAMAKESIQRGPKFPYFYYVTTLGKNLEDGLRSAKKGLKCGVISPFIRVALMHRTVEIAGNLGVTRLQESRVGDKKWEEGIAFLTSALDDAKTYPTEAPPDARHVKDVLYWYICLTITVKGPEISIGLGELQGALRKLRAADEISTHLGTPPPRTQIRMTQQNIAQRYDAPGVRDRRSVVARFDGLSPTDLQKQTISPVKAKYDLAAWLDEMDVESGEQSYPGRSSHPRFSVNTVALYRCSWCGNPSAVLRKCSGCEKMRWG
ncbi:hypothetical protein BV22DRAFT_1121170 [Leucogyrophana mollusca]|uniref:Uncharacterized protein n=1 Tax=Leucogyrophana mollusca TaxID=85980 RepID=A0ACB8BCF3_9AGAM|nr:hypothetical protein BV22DRAFT_1121170 [Leucogyrophana mollusca]